MNRRFEGVGVTSHITELRRPEEFDADRKKAITSMLTLSTENEARLVFAKKFERRHDLIDKGFLYCLLYLKRIQGKKTCAS